MRALLISTAVALSLAAGSTRADMVSYAFVREDGSLQVNNRTVWLYGIYIPVTDETCRTFINPIQCGTRASLALDFKIGPSFVRCKRQWKNRDGSITAICTADGVDLSAWMLENGWAVALPDAPFEYVTLERIARARGFGIWGIPVDNVQIRPHRGHRHSPGSR